MSMIVWIVWSFVRSSTKQISLSVRWRGMERNGEEWRGMERNGEEWKGGMERGISGKRLEMRSVAILCRILMRILGKVHLRLIVTNGNQ